MTGYGGVRVGEFSQGPPFLRHTPSPSALVNVCAQILLGDLTPGRPAADLGQHALACSGRFDMNVLHAFMPPLLLSSSLHVVHAHASNLRAAAALACVSPEHACHDRAAPCMFVSWFASRTAARLRPALWGGHTGYLLGRMHHAKPTPGTGAHAALARPAKPGLSSTQVRGTASDTPRSYPPAAMAMAMDARGLR